MAEFVAVGLPVGDAADYDDYSSRVSAAMRDLAASGRLQQVASLEDFLEIADRVRLGVRAAAADARRRGADECTLRVPMTTAEHRTMTSMGPSLQTVMEILTIRGTIDTTPPDGAFRMMSALGLGALE